MVRGQAPRERIAGSSSDTSRYLVRPAQTRAVEVMLNQHVWQIGALLLIALVVLAIWSTPE